MEPIAPSGAGGQRQSSLGPATASGSRRRSPSGRSQGRSEDEREMVALSTEDDGSDISDEDLHDDEEAGLTGGDRRRKQHKRHRNTQLDQRVAPDIVTEDERKEADRTVVKDLLINGVLIALWYTFSLSISLYNKWMFDPEKLNFAFPLFTTSVHMLVQFSLASIVLFLFPSLRPQNASRSDPTQRHDPEKPLMTKMFYLTRIGPCGLATGLDIGLGNTSLKFITLTFYTMCKSSSLAFVLLFAFLFRLESPTLRLTAIIATMTAGVIMMVAGEVSFSLPGFLLVISAAFFSGFRWALTQILLLRNPATSNPFSSIFFLAPVMFLSLVLIAIPVEGPAALLDGLGAIAAERGVWVAPLLVLFPGCIAFFMTASEFALLKRTSVVTLSIAGIFKEAMTISAAAAVFGDTMTPINVVGLTVTIVAIAAYNYIKIRKMRDDAQTVVHRAHAHLEEQEEVEVESEVGEEEEGEDAGLLNRGGDGAEEVAARGEGDGDGQRGRQ
ncbi:triose-phosphate transporter family-domain-containing protein [Schizothecium vesticola]|uniref:Triose-phosphate transporter family-domain-containing protein n=1 Tax=Schizothecium vesticola TaxID=314040 RepID=A0AA40FA50_9PEZI|nr:triose-phosphate transporter family-domain-containing protein [Schizothecium vesticola]